MNFVRIKNDREVVKLPVKNKKLKVNVVRQYFPGANGLTFSDGDSKCGVAMEDENFILIDGVQEYEVFQPTSSRDISGNDAKRRRIDQIMNIIDGKKDNNPSSSLITDDPIPLKKDLKTLHVGWKHRENNNENYKQMTTPIGGIKKIELNRNLKYTFDEIKKMSVTSMTSIYSKDLLSNSEILVGNFQEEISNNFTDGSKKRNDFWEFSDKLKMKNSQLRLYILSTTLKSEDSVTTSSPTKVDEKKELSSTSGKSLGKTVYSGSVLKFSMPKKKTFSNTEHNVRSSQSREASASTSTENIENQLRFSVPTIAEEDIKFTDRVLGRGAFGCVILSVWNNTEVAVKKIKQTIKRKYLYREMNVMDKIRHPNLISIMGICQTKDFLYIIMEYFKSTNLREFILKRDKNLDYAVKTNENYSIALQICQSIAFLHDFKPTILHKDIKPDNILINNFLTVKICDFGLSKICDGASALETTVGPYYRGTPAYLAPEILIDREQGGAASDVWALACTIVELFTERKICNVTPFSVSNLKEVVAAQKIPCLEDISMVIRDTLENCFESNPNMRPRTAELVQLFKLLYVEEN